jgi:hypothetical protein
MARNVYDQGALAYHSPKQNYMIYSHSLYESAVALWRDPKFWIFKNLYFTRPVQKNKYKFSSHQPTRGSTRFHLIRLAMYEQEYIQGVRFFNILL